MTTETRRTLNGRIAYTVGEDFQAMTEEIRIAHTSYAKQKAQVEHAEAMRKVMIATIKEEQRKQLHAKGEKVTESRLDDLARSQLAYENFLQALFDEKKELAVLEANYYALRNKLDIAMEQMRYARAEMHLHP